ncbi:unnamed protein product [Menidia menidia]|uniref:(Atlantic silverside) hypothetical protein n=1 Tax=Menidia menidia TaxID=238744 RepID=A0A8S4BNC3_9TELE|nr:unnamed protein product [Menidia menidia]
MVKTPTRRPMLRFPSRTVSSPEAELCLLDRAEAQTPVPRTSRRQSSASGLETVLLGNRSIGRLVGVFTMTDVQPLLLLFLPTETPPLHTVVKAGLLVPDHVPCGLKEQDVPVSFWKGHYAVAWLHIKDCLALVKAPLTLMGPSRHHRPHLQVQHSSGQQEQAGVQSSSAAPLKLLTWCYLPGQASLSDLLLQLLLKLFDSPHCSLLLGSDLLLHIRASVLDETDQLSEHLLTVLQCFVSRLIDGLHLLLEQIHILLFVLDSLLDLLPPPLQLSLPLSPFCCR